jgi:nitrous oxide reductase
MSTDTSNGSKKTARRHFLKTAAVAGGAATVAAAGKAALAGATPEPVMEQAPQAVKKGYHLTAHIETYYRLARG